MRYAANSMSESLCVKAPRSFVIHSSSLTKAIHKSRISRLIFSLKSKSSQSPKETIDSGFTRFNAIVTSLKSLNPDYSSKNHVRKLLCALPLKWRAKVMAIEEAKDLATLPLDELIGNLKVYEMVLDNDGVTSKTTKEKVKSLALKAKVTREHTSDDNDCQNESDEDVDKEEAEAFNLLARNFRHFASECRNPKENKAFIGGAWSDSEDGDEQPNDATCLMDKSYETKDFTKTKFYHYISYWTYSCIDSALIQNTLLKPEFHFEGTPSPSWDKS
uniref:UBN2 domain-containing protein n=1 Tax=Tanacetum cinerariifolium TaxID=118510 RepID=A0A6L2K7U1_TANCI|nr:hypothetical protein [Tanacetum cinerariifolium]